MMPEYEREVIAGIKATMPDLAPLPEWVLYELYSAYSASHFAGWLCWDPIGFRKWADHRIQEYRQDMEAAP